MSSVLKNRRNQSKALYVSKANELYAETINFLSRMSARYSRLMAHDIAELAGEVLNHAEKANTYMPTTRAAYDARKAHLLEARASLNALDVKMAHAYDVMILNPQGCFTTAKGNNVPASEATKKLESMADRCGCLIEDEKELLHKIMESDTNRIKKEEQKQKDKQEEEQNQ